LVERLETTQSELSDAQREIETLKTELAQAHFNTHSGNYY